MFYRDRRYRTYASINFQLNLVITATYISAKHLEVAALQECNGGIKP